MRQRVVESPTPTTPPTKGIENLNGRGKFFGKITKKSIVTSEIKVYNCCIK